MEATPAGSPAFFIATSAFCSFYHSVVTNFRHPAFARQCAVFLALFLVGMRPAAGALWELDLSGRDLGAAPEFGQNLEIREEDGLRFLSKTDAATQFLFANQLPSEASGWTNLLFRVKYREHEKPTLSLVVKARGLRGDVPYMQYYISIRGDGIGVLCHGMTEDGGVDKKDPRVNQLVKFSSLGLPDLPLGGWITAEARVGDEVVLVRVDAGDGVTREVELPVLTGTGGVSLLTRGPIDVAAVTVEEAGAEVVPSR